VEPYHTISEEIGETIIISGNPDFFIFSNNSSDSFLPVNCWRFENSEIYLINDEVYEPFIIENEGLVEYIEENIDIRSFDCQSVLEIKSLIASVYANYINAGEESVASQFLKKYYLCEDADQFKEQLRLLTAGINDENGLD
jgi:hypothetical protein